MITILSIGPVRTLVTLTIIVAGIYFLIRLFKKK